MVNATKIFATPGRILAVLLLGLAVLLTAAWLRGAEYDEQYTLFLTAGMARPTWPDDVFPAGAIVYDDRYILLIGGFQYANVMDPGGEIRPKFGKINKHYPEKDYCSDVLIFDTKTNKFGRATPLPLNNNMPMAVIRGEELHLIGGETGGSVIEGEPYAHHPDLYLIGKLSKAASPSK